MPPAEEPQPGDPRSRRDRPGDSTGDSAEIATAPARWLLEAGSDGGVALTATYALARAVVREAAERWPAWWNAELFGPPHREADLAVLEALHDGLRRLKLMRRRARKLHTTQRGRELVSDDTGLLRVLIADLGGGDRFATMVAAVVLDKLATRAPLEHDDLVRPALARARCGRWQDGDGQPPGEREVSWVLTEVLCRGEAYGVIDRFPQDGESRFRRSQIVLTAAARAVLGARDEPPSAGTTVLVFDAELVDVPDVRARIAVGLTQHLTALHDAIQEAFQWCDDHLYSFWLDGRFWGEKDSEFVRPGTPDAESRTAYVPLADLDLAVGARIAYVFDYGDEWRVQLMLTGQTEADAGSYPRVLKRDGTPPPQYPHTPG